MQLSAGFAVFWVRSLIRSRLSAELRGLKGSWGKSENAGNRMVESNVRQLSIVYPLKGAVSGTDGDPDNPFRRALAPLIEESKLLPSMLPVFTTSQPDGPCERWLGIFVRSPGGRILFFPGLDDPTRGVRGNENGTEVFSRDLHLDHLSLERSRDRWHLTSPGSRDHQSGPKALDVGGGRVFWFTMAVQDLSLLRLARNRTVAEFTVQTEAQSFKIQQLQQLSENGRAGKICLPPEPDDDRPHFPFFTVIVGPTGFDAYKGPDWWPPYPSRHVTDGPKAEAFQVPRIEITHNSLDKETDLQVSACWLEGSMDIPMIQMSPSGS